VTLPQKLISLFYYFFFKKGEKKVIYCPIMHNWYQNLLRIAIKIFFGEILEMNGKKKEKVLSIEKMERGDN
jgi:hypothetical protein